jgi:glycosyltransferase involved in cell wall biosynthesis
LINTSFCCHSVDARRFFTLAHSDDQLDACESSVREKAGPIASRSTKILIVLVRYQTPLQQSKTMQTLGTCLAADVELGQRFSLLVWDNTPAGMPMGQSVSGFPMPIEYRHSNENAGVAGAYNYAMELAEQRGFSWLLLLDQDTTLSPGFLAAMHGHASRLEKEEKIAAIAPTMLMGSRPVSPKIMARWGGATDPSPGFEGPVFKELIIMNSGMLLRVAALRRIGGYSLDFWLDFSDRYVCHMLAKQKYGAWLAGEQRLQHEVSLMSGEGGTSPERYENLMGAQDAYFSQYKSFLRNVVFCQRLLRTALRERKLHPERSRLLFTHLVRRFTVPKRRRLEDWRRTVSARRKASGRAPS